MNVTLWMLLFAFMVGQCQKTNVVVVINNYPKLEIDQVVFEQINGSQSEVTINVINASIVQGICDIGYQYRNFSCVPCVCSTRSHFLSRWADVSLLP